MGSLLKTRRGRFVAVSTAVVTLLCVMAGLAHAAVGVLSNGTFESGDGNITVDNGSGYHDWAGLGTLPLTFACDLPDSSAACGNAGAANDQSFGQGAKEDGSCPSEVTGSIPPNKSDLTRLYLTKETALNGDILVYMAWERTNNLGNANMDFEFNQAQFGTNLCPTSEGPTPVPMRQDGDMLISFDFGGGTPVLSLSRWIVSSSEGSCYSAKAVPCWSGHTALNSAVSNGAVNDGTLKNGNTVLNGPFTDNVLASDPETVPLTGFGEAGVDLTAAGVFKSNTCQSFGTAYMKSRSATSFTAEMKDFIAPVPFTLNNCSVLLVSKFIDTNADGVNDGATLDPAGSGWSFHVTGPSVDCSGLTDDSGNLSTCIDGSGNAVDLTKLQQGSYTITEAQQTGYVNTKSGSTAGILPGSLAASPQATVTLGLADNKAVTFGNTCLIDKTFKVTGVPSYYSTANGNGLYVQYTIKAGSFDPVNGGALSSDLGPATVTLTRNATANLDGTYDWSAHVTGKFIYTSNIVWRWGIVGVTGTASGGTDSPIGTATNRGTCAATNAVPFATYTISGTKYKDADHNGARDNLVGTSTLEPGVVGFHFQISPGSLFVAASKLGSDAISAADGSFSFTGIGPGTYTIHEVPAAGWVQTQPASASDLSIAVAIDGTVAPSTILFGNTPLSDISVTLHPETNATHGSISCAGKDQSGNTQTMPSASPTPSPGQNSNYSANGLPPGTYNCTVTVTDP